MLWMMNVISIPYSARTDKCSKEDKAKYITEDLDHTKWSTRLDEELFVQFLDFYNTAIK